MLRKNFQQELEKLHLKLLEMGTIVERVIELAIEGLEEKNLEKSHKAIALDEKVDELELEIEKDCINLFALQTPVAIDLRRISTILKIITDLERIGDYAVNIAYETIDIDNRELIKPLKDIPKMAELTRIMVKMCLDSFVKEDAKLAQQTAEMDDLVDDLYDKIYLELVEKLDNRENGKQIIHLLFIGRHLERMADHVTNICEKIVYMTTNKRVTF